MPCPAARRGERVFPKHDARGGKGAAIHWAGRYQPECRLDAGFQLAPLCPARHQRVLGAGCLLLITPRVAQKGGHFPHRRRLRALVERRPCSWRSHIVGEVRCVQPAGGQAPEELRGAFERGVGIATVNERRDRRRLLRLSAAPAQAPQAVMDAATVAGRGKGGTQEIGRAQDRMCPVIEGVASLDVVCEAGTSDDDAQTQVKEAEHYPQPPQGGAGLHGAIAAAAQRGGERGDGGEGQRGTQEANCTWHFSGETMKIAFATRIARASVGKRARAKRQAPTVDGTTHQSWSPTAASSDWPVANMIQGADPIAKNAHPACPIAKLTRSRRPAADSRAASNTPLTAAELDPIIAAAAIAAVVAASIAVTVAAAVADREGEVAAPWTSTLDSEPAPRRSRRQPARPRSSRVGSMATAMATAKAIAIRRRRSRWFRGVAAGAQARELGQSPRERVEAHTAIARQITPLPGPGINPRAVLLVAGIVVRLTVVPVANARSVTRHAAAPTLGRTEPRLVLVEPEPQAIRRSELCRDEGILLRRADAGRYALVVFAEVHAAEERGGALGRHEKAARAPRGAGGRGRPTGWAGGRGEREEEEDDRQHASRDHEIVVAHAEATREYTQRLACDGRAAVPRRCQHGHSRIIVTNPLERLGAGWNGRLRGVHLLVDERWRRGLGSEKRPGRRCPNGRRCHKNLR
eukprot:scaffold18016_cov65-Phaeocystis_antarctica.AAC.2